MKIKKITRFTLLALCVWMFLICCVWNIGFVCAEPIYTPSDLRNADISALVSQSKFDSRDYGVVTSVKDQGNTTLCWAYSTVAASESSILRSGIDKNVNLYNLFLSPNQIGYARHNRGADPLGFTKGEKTSVSGNWQYESGGTKYSAALLSQWCGPVLSNTAYNANGWENSAYKLKSAIMVKGDKLDTDDTARNKMKHAIVKYGGVTFSYNNVRETEYYNPKGENGSYPHACTVIGWDDTIPAERFGPGETKIDGGWLIKNSYSSLPYFYLSYEVTCQQIYAFDYAEKDEYDFNYFYDSALEDNGIGSLLKIKKAANVYTCQNNNEYIKAVNIGTVGENSNCTVDIYTDVRITDGKIDLKNSNLAESKNVYLEYGGYNCIEFDKPISIKKDKKFAAVVTLSGGDAYITLGNNDNTENLNSNYLYRGGWTEYSSPPRIKIFTKTNMSVDDEKEAKAKIEAVGDYEFNVIGLQGRSYIICVYRKGEYLKDISVKPIEFKNDGEKIRFSDIPDSWTKHDDTHIDVYMWENTGNIKPMCEKLRLF